MTINPYRLGTAVLQQAWDDAFHAAIGSHTASHDKAQAILFLASREPRYVRLRQLWATAADLDPDVLRERALRRWGHRPLPQEPLASLGRNSHCTVLVERVLRECPESDIVQLARRTRYTRSKVLHSLATLHEHGVLDTERYRSLSKSQ